eukprot:411867-Pleurochrysis_carterae.AAC.1
MRTSVGWFSSPSCALINQCSKYVALHSSMGYAIGAKFWQWLDAELHSTEEESFDNELLGSIEDMLAICGYRDNILFIDTAVTDRFSQTGSLRAYQLAWRTRRRARPSSPRSAQSALRRPPSARTLTRCRLPSTAPS